jgi:hypothetical protein
VAQLSRLVSSQRRSDRVRWVESWVETCGRQHRGEAATWKPWVRNELPAPSPATKLEEGEPRESRPRGFAYDSIPSLGTPDGCGRQAGEEEP